jgi:2-oxoglutarate dehydrogenase E2 component (dihydrolipoamide succinyltransferase)
MAKYQLLLPKMGESVAEATVIKWTKNPGDRIEADDTVMEIATDKVDSEVPSPVSGKLVEQRYKQDDVVQVGSVIAIIETDEPEEVTLAPQAAAPQPVITPQPVKEEPVAQTQPQDIPGIAQLEQKSAEPVAPQNTPNFKSGSRFYSPLVKQIALQENISIDQLENIPGSGAEGRLTKDDLLDHIRNNGGNSQPKEPAAEAPRSEYTRPAVSASGADEIIEMDRMRRLIADHMVMSKQTSPHVTSFVEADVTALVLWREKIKSSFEKREGEKITFTPIFVEAVAKAIKDYPMVNVSVNGTQIIKKADINIGMATALPNGNLIVPVIKKADELNLLGLTKAVNSLAGNARSGKLQPDDVKDGTFTITNIGGFNNIMGTPIINQPQVAILAVGAIKKKPAVIETPQGDVIAIRHMMFLSLSYDHRVVDGGLGGSFLARIAHYLENWDANRQV